MKSTSNPKFHAESVLFVHIWLCRSTFIIFLIFRCDIINYVAKQQTMKKATNLWILFVCVSEKLPFCLYVIHFGDQFYKMFTHFLYFCLFFVSISMSLSTPNNLVFIRRTAPKNKKHRIGAIIVHTRCVPLGFVCKCFCLDFKSKKCLNKLYELMFTYLLLFA